MSDDHEHSASSIYVSPSEAEGGGYGYLPGVLGALGAPGLPELDRECGDCQGNGIVTTPEWRAWNEREKAAEAEWRAEYPAGSWYGSEAFELMSDLQPEPEMDCPKCQGSGHELTDAGRTLLAFLQRHPPALTRVVLGATKSSDRNPGEGTQP